jgi:hypothetical protein
MPRITEYAPTRPHLNKGALGYDPSIVTGTVPEPPDIADGAAWEIPAQILTIIEADDLNLSDGTVADGGGTKTFSSPTNANDGSTATSALRSSFANPGGTQTSILKTDLGAAFEVETMYIVGGTGPIPTNTTAVPWTLERSDDGSAWTAESITQTDGTVATTANSTLTLDTPATHRYWRIIHSTAAGGFIGNLHVTTWAISGSETVLGDIAWIPALNVNDGDDATSDYVTEDAITETGGTFLRIKP